MQGAQRERDAGAGGREREGGGEPGEESKGEKEEEGGMRASQREGDEMQGAHGLFPWVVSKDKHVVVRLCLTQPSDGFPVSGVWRGHLRGLSAGLLNE